MPGSHLGSAARSPLPAACLLCSEWPSLRPSLRVWSLALQLTPPMPSTVLRLNARAELSLQPLNAPLTHRHASAEASLSDRSLSPFIEASLAVTSSRTRTGPDQSPALRTSALPGRRTRPRCGTASDRPQAKSRVFRRKPPPPATPNALACGCIREVIREAGY